MAVYRVAVYWVAIFRVAVYQVAVYRVAVYRVAVFWVGAHRMVAHRVAVQFVKRVLQSHLLGMRVGWLATRDKREKGGFGLVAKVGSYCLLQPKIARICTA